MNTFLLQMVLKALATLAILTKNKCCLYLAMYPTILAQKLVCFKEKLYLCAMIFKY